MNVLIVDDNKAAADLLRELLALQDHEAHCTYTAQQAIAAAAEKAFDAALVDLVLPDLPGAELARRMRASAGNKPLLLIAISGFGADEAGGTTTPGLFDHHLQKPIDFEDLDRILAPPAAR
ncbi:response regulator [Variovorax sp. LjRoot290]|uniref:response regulator n=1 Tax=unclassified Variovorax TaxID=663243 RepID=UPI000886986B|nr:response regulator [Variovorax sp. CF079]SDE34525.1 Response regulator receiver domain-containing protein [Variovorax sp. CF079]